MVPLCKVHNFGFLKEASLASHGIRRTTIKTPHVLCMIYTICLHGHLSQAIIVSAVEIDLTARSLARSLASYIQNHFHRCILHMYCICHIRNDSLSRHVQTHAQNGHTKHEVQFLV